MTKREGPRPLTGLAPLQTTPKLVIACVLLGVCAVLASIPRVALAETLEVASWSDLCDALDESGTADTVKLTADIRAAGDNETKTLCAKRTVTLDLNGHSLDRGLVNKDEDEGLGDVGSNTSVLQVGTGANLTIKNSAKSVGTITGGVCLYGGGIFVYGGGKLAVEDGVQISGNKANYGGGIYVASGTVDLKRGAVISSNSAVEGGGLFVGVAQNEANAAGGEVTVTKANCTFRGCTVQGNSARSGGGGVFIKKGNLTIEDGKIAQNAARGEPGHGAGLYQQGGTVVMNGGSIERNTSAYLYPSVYKEFCHRGGGVYQEAGSFTLNKGTIAHNLARGCGGGFCQSPKDLAAVFTMTGGSISENETHGADPLFDRPAPAYGAGIYQVCDAGSDSLATIKITGGSIMGNRANILPSKGGGICMSGGTLELSGCMISNNWAVTGGGVYLDYTSAYSSKGQSLTLGPNLAITGNTAIDVHTLPILHADNVFIPIQDAPEAREHVTFATNANSNVGIRTHPTVAPGDGYTDIGLVDTGFSWRGLHSDFGDEHMVVVNPNDGYVAMWKHTHVWDCAVDATDASKAQVFCADEVCPYHEEVGTVVLDAEDAIYDGKPHEAYPKVSGVPRDSCGLSIAYFDRRSGTSVKLDDAPTNAGTYLAKVTINTAGSNKAVEIKKAYDIARRTATVQASDQAVIRGNVIEQGPSYASLHATWGVEHSGPVRGHRLADVSLSPTDAQTQPGIIKVTSAKVADAAGANMSANYNLTYIDGVLTIADVVPDYTPPLPKTLTYAGEDQELVVPGTSDEADILYSLSRKGPFETSIPTGKDAGTYTVWYTVEPKANAPEHLSGLQPQAVTVVIAQLPADLSWGYEQATYDGEEHVPSAHLKINCLKPGDTCNVTVEGAAKDAGVHTATATGLSNPNYTLQGGTNLTNEFWIKQRPVTVSGIAAKDKVYDATTSAMLDCSGVTFGEQGENKGKLSGDDLSVHAIGEFARADVGSGVPVSLKDLTLTGASAGNYTLDKEAQQQAGAKANIVARPVVVRAKNQVVKSGERIGQGVEYALLQPIVGDGQSGPIAGHELSSITLAPAYAVTQSGLISPSEATITSSSDGSRADVSSNYRIHYEEGTLVVTGEEPAYALPQPKSLVYNGSDQELVEEGTVQEGSAYRFVYSLDESTALDSWSTEVPSGTSAGSYTVYYQLVAEEDNTQSLLGTQSIETVIGRRPITVVPHDGQGKVYGNSDPAILYEAENWGRGMARLQGALSRIEGANAGTYAITQGTITNDDGRNSNYTIVFDTSKSFAVRRRPVTVAGITASDRTYDGTTAVALDKSNASLLNVIDQDKGDDKLRFVDCTGVFVTPDRGDDKDVLLKSVQLSGSATQNYTSRTDQTITADIVARKTIIRANDQTVLSGTRIGQGVGFARMDKLSDTGQTGPCAGQGLSAIALLPQDPVVTGGIITPDGAAVSDAYDNDVTANYDIAYEDGMLIVLNVTPSYDAPVAREGLVYDGTEQALVEPGKVYGRDGSVIVYSLSRDGEYHEDVPRAKDAGTYEVWWKIVLASDYSKPVGTLPAQQLNVTVAPKEATVGWMHTMFWYDGREHAPEAVVTNLAEGDACDVSVSGAQSRIGTHMARAYALTNPNYYLPAGVTSSYVIQKATGTVPVKVVCEPGAPTVESENLQEVAQALVTDEELGLAANGEDLLVWLQVTKLAQDEVPDGDVSAFKSTLDALGAHAGTYLDISLFKKVGDKTTRIERTPQSVGLDLTVPEGLHANGRTFYLLRCHDGSVTELASGTGEMLSVESGLFSSYLIAYKDSESGENGSSNGSKYSRGTTLARTADTTTLPMLAGAFVLVGCACIALARQLQRRS